MNQRATLIVVVPHDRADRMRVSGGWRVGRSNQHTVTLLGDYPTEAEAHVAGRRHDPLVWSVERAAA